MRRLTTDATELNLSKKNILKSLVNIFSIYIFYYNNSDVPNFNVLSDVGSERRINAPFHNKLTILVTKNSLSVFSRFPLTSSKV